MDGALHGAPPGAAPAAGLPAASSVLAVCAHPDDESFGLGALLDAFARSGAATAVLCFTHGEGSTLCASPDEVDRLHELRAEELDAAAKVLGVGTVVLRDHADGALSDVPVARLAADVVRVHEEVGADLLVTFDEGGVTGHPDHVGATRAAVEAGAVTGSPVLGWALERAVAESLNVELGTAFAGRVPAEVDALVGIDRARQLRAIACHRSQATGNPVLWRRLALQGDREAVRWLRARRAVFA